MNINYSVLGNQLFASALKGVIDFGYVEIALKIARFFALFRVRG
jgi:hypothetical protein